MKRELLKKILIYMPLVLGVVIFTWLAWLTFKPEPLIYDEGGVIKVSDTEEAVDGGYSDAKGVVKEILADETKDYSGFQVREQKLKVELISGDDKGAEVTAINNIAVDSPYYLPVKEGQKLLLYREIVEDKEQFYVQDILRENYIALMLLIFVGLLVAVGKKKGVKSVITLALTIAFIAYLLLPLIIEGYNPILISSLVSILIIITTLYILDGINVKTLSAMIGTAAGVLIAAILTAIIGKAAYLTGLGSQEAQMLYNADLPFRFRDLLFASIIISALGAIMDVSMSIASSMDEVKKVNTSIKIKDLIKSGMNVGRDIMGTMSNTLILVYTGTSIFTMLLFKVNDIAYSKMINLDAIASDIVSALAGSIGLILTIPITAVTAGMLEEFLNKKEV